MSQVPGMPDQGLDAPPAKGMAVGALVCSIVGCCVPVVGIVGIVLGIVALVKAKSDARRYGGGGMALAAIIVGALSLIVVVLFWVFLGFLFPVLHQLGKARRHASSVEIRSVEPVVSHASLAAFGGPITRQ